MPRKWFELKDLYRFNTPLILPTLSSNLIFFSQHPLGRQNALHAAMNRGRLMHSPRQPLENRLDYVVTVLAMQQINMQGYSRMLRKRPHKLQGQGSIKVPDLLIRHDNPIMHEWPIRDINHDPPRVSSIGR